MAAMFSKPKTPKVPEPPKAADEDAVEADQARRSRLRRGRASTQLVSGNGGGPATAARALTGN